MWSSTYYNYWQYWNLYHKVTFDGPNRLIIVNYGETSLNTEIDIYSDWKEWIALEDYAKYPQALSTIGGEPLGAGQFVGSTYFLENGWRIRPWEGDHQLTINGNLYTRESGESPVVSTIGRWNIITSFIRSSVVSTIEIPSTNTSSANINTQDIAEAIWKYSTSGSTEPDTMGSHVFTKLITFAEHMATK